jgi:hypothetical protein
MKTRDEQVAAKCTMNAAEEALAAYVTRPLDANADPALHRRLIEEFRRATEEFLETVS